MATYSRRGLYARMGTWDRGGMWRWSDTKDFLSLYDIFRRLSREVSHGILIFPTHHASDAYELCRCLIACFKFLGRCACPDCLIPRNEFWKMGTKIDIARRTSKARVDSKDIQDRLARVRVFIFEKGLSPDSMAVDDLIGAQSLTPTRVRSCSNRHCRDVQCLPTTTGSILYAIRSVRRQPLEDVCTRHYA